MNPAQGGMRQGGQTMPQMPNNPRQGGGQMTPGQGSGANIPQGAQFVPTGMIRGAGQNQYQSQIDDLMWQLQRAQIQGADPMTIASLQFQLQQAQRAQQQQAQRFAYQRERNRPGFGGGSVGSAGRGFRPGQSEMRGNQLYDMETQMLLALMGAGGGPGGPIMG